MNTLRITVPFRNAILFYVFARNRFSSASEFSIEEWVKVKFPYPPYTFPDFSPTEAAQPQGLFRFTIVRSSEINILFYHQNVSRVLNIINKCNFRDDDATPVGLRLS